MDKSARDPAISEMIRVLAMERHQTAGWIAPHYRDSEVWGRANLSSSYYLLTGDEPLPFHRLDGIEIWHFYMGAPVEVVVSNGGKLREISLLGADLAAGQRPQLAVPAYRWQSCRSLGSWSLLGFTMSPAYSPRTAIVMDSNC